MRKSIIAGAFTCALVSMLQSEAFADFANFDLKSQVDTYEQRYPLPDSHTKLVDNQGNGFEPLYGVRNFRAVLEGVYYRGGANNFYHRNSKRKNSNPLPNDGLLNLCQEGFKEAVYLYPERYSSAPQVISCRDFNGVPNQLQYLQITALSGKNNSVLLQLIYSHIKGKTPGPIYAHCWNGWHASGYVAAITLKQFCGYSDHQADAYWVRNTDGNLAGMSRVRAKVRAFKPLPNLTITAEEKRLICPK